MQYQPNVKNATKLNINTSIIEAKLISVIDSDVLKVVVYPWPGIKCNALVRLSGIIVPSVKSENAEEKIMAEKVVEFLNLLFKDKEVIKIANMRRGRISSKILAEVFIDDKINVANELVNTGFAKFYIKNE